MAGADSAGEHPRRHPRDSRAGPSDRGAGEPPGSRSTDRGAGEHPNRHPSDRGAGSAHAVIEYLRANPQVFVLLVICIVLGLGTFLAVVFGLLTAGSGRTTGEPSGAIMRAHALIAAAHPLIP